MPVNRVLLLALLVLPTVAYTQGPPEFQLVSIRRVPPESCPPGEICFGAYAPSRAPSSISFSSGGRFEARNQTVESLVRIAFGFDRIDPRAGIVDGGGLPSARTARFDITALAEDEWGPPPPGESVPAKLRTMLQLLLEKRFMLRTRIEMKRMDVAAVTLIGSEPGPGLRPSSQACLGPFSDPPLLGTAAAARCPYRFDASRIEAGSITMGEVARLLSAVPGLSSRQVFVDKTGLAGRFDLTFDIGNVNPARMIVNVEGDEGVRGTMRSANPAAERRPSALRDALAKQLSLKLVNEKLSIPRLKIEHAENPAED